MHQLKFIAIPGLVAIVIFFSIELFNNFSETIPSQEPENILGYNGYSEGINTIIFDSQGRVDYTLQATKQITYSDNITELEQPYIQLYKDGESQWNITAESGKFSTATPDSSEINQIDLTGDVEVFQLDNLGNRTVIATDFLTLDPILETANTDVLVTMFSEDLEQTAIGMQADLNSREYVFLRQTRGRYAN